MSFKNILESLNSSTELKRIPIFNAQNASEEVTDYSVLLRKVKHVLLEVVEVTEIGTENTKEQNSGPFFFTFYESKYKDDH